MPSFRLKRPELNENDIERACLDLLDIRGWYHVRIQCGLFRSPDGKRWIRGERPGTPDYFVGHSTHGCFFLETKRPRGKLSRDQEFTRMAIEQGYRIPIVVADSAALLRQWLDSREGKAA